jgi:hypothetical protein
MAQPDWQTDLYGKGSYDDQYKVPFYLGHIIDQALNWCIPILTADLFRYIWHYTSNQLSIGKVDSLLMLPIFLMD